MENNTLDLKTMFGQARSLELVLRNSESYSSSPSSVNAAVPPTATGATWNLANDWNLKSTFRGQGILDPVPAIRDLQHTIRNPQRVIQKPRFSLMHLILEECQPVSRRVSFHKRRSSIRKS